MTPQSKKNILHTHTHIQRRNQGRKEAAAAPCSCSFNRKSWFLAGVPIDIISVPYRSADMEKWVVVLLLLAAMELAPAEVTRRYVGVGGELRVEPPKISGPITGVLWKFNVNLLAEWIKDSLDLTYYGGFDGRTTLDTTTGALRVRNMRVEDAGEYSVEINSKLQDLRFDVKVIQEVTEPKVVVRPVACSSALESCTLSCDGDTAGSEPVSYFWRTDDGAWEKSEKDLVINKTEKVKTFSCRMENPVSHRDSKSEDNPFLRSDGSTGGVVATIIIIIIIIIIAVAIVSFVFRKKLLALLPSNSAPETTLATNGGAASEVPKEENVALNNPKESPSDP